MNSRIFDVFKTVLLCWIYFYGIWSVLSDILFSAMSLSLIGVLITLSVIYFVHIPAPNKTTVDNLIGKDPILDSVENDNFFMKVVAHRGAGLDAPENSLIAFKLCAEKGCTGVEFDVSLTADDVPIIFHDENLERLADSTAAVRKMTWKELSSVDISIKHPLKEKFLNTKIAKLDDTVLQCLNNKQKMFIDLKEIDNKVVKIIIDLYKKFPELETKAVCSSFFPQVIYKIRRANPRIVCSLAWRPYAFTYESFSAISGVGLARSSNYLKHFYLKCWDVLYEWALERILYYIIGISIVLIHKDAISGKLVHDWRARGVRVIAWTVNHPVEKQHFSRILKLTYMTDTLIGETTAHAINK